jgi:hypothetical protein
MARKKPIVAFTLEQELLAEIEDRRGMIPRSTYVNYLLKIALEKQKKEL